MRRQVIIGGLVVFSFFMASLNPALAFECTPVNKPKLWRAQAPVPAKPFKAEPNPERQRALQQMKKKLPKGMQLSETLSLRTGLPTELSFGGTINTPVSSNPDPVEIANQFLKEWQNALGIDLSQLGAPVVRKDKYGFLLEYPQVYQGVPVQRGEIKLVLSIFESDIVWHGAITRVYSSYFPNISAPIAPKITAEQALKTVEECMEQRLDKEPISKEPMVSKTTLVILPDCDVKGVSKPCEYFLAWHVPHAYYVDALTGKIIQEAFVVMF